MCITGSCDKSLVLFQKWKVVESFSMLHKAFSIVNFSLKDFSCLLKWIVIISFMFLFIFCIMLSDGIFFSSCLNKFLPFRISFNTDVFIVIISFLVLCSVFIESNPKMFVIGLLSEFLLSFWIIGSKVFHIFFLFLQLYKTWIIVSLSLLYLSQIGDILFLCSAISCFWLISNIQCSSL